MPGCLFACKGLFFLREPCYNLNDPQGNGKTKPIFALFNVSPRKGTEAFTCSIINGDITTEPTHTPQGDVNENRLSKRESSSEPTHTPQGDGSQLNADPVGLVVAANQLTPRKGTENLRSFRTQYCSHKI